MKKIYQKTKNTQKGAVSLFIVIFTALLLTTIAVSFIQLMVKDQRQASNADLSESAYDSAVAGVEDAKRALIRLYQCAGNGSEECNNIRTAMTSPDNCQALGSALQVLDGGEAKLKIGGSDANLDQAYTCVKITTDTDSYLGTLNSGSGPAMVPLRGKDPFNRVVVRWSIKKASESINLESIAGTASMPTPGTGSGQWPGNRPALMRAQLIDGRGSFNLSDFDNDGYSNTLFLYPVSSGGVASVQFGLDTRRDTLSKIPQKINCDNSAAAGAYICSATIDFATAIPAGASTTFLNLMALYNAADFRVELYNGAAPVIFDGVQPEVDSTGRANDLFRRVVSRIELGNAFNYPSAALETTGDLCKKFSITDNVADYTASSTCTP